VWNIFESISTPISTPRSLHLSSTIRSLSLSLSVSFSHSVFLLFSACMKFVHTYYYIVMYEVWPISWVCVREFVYKLPLKLFVKRKSILVFNFCSPLSTPLLSSAHPIPHHTTKMTGETESVGTWNTSDFYLILLRNIINKLI